MKTCDVCKRTSEEANSLQDGFVSTVKIGTDIQVARLRLAPVAGPGVPDEFRNKCPIECELCSDCIEKVNDSIAAHLQNAFGLRIRK